MPKSEIIPCTKEEIKDLIEVAMNDDFFYMLFMVAKKTGRRLGEFYGTPNKIKKIKKVRVRNKLGETRIKEKVVYLNKGYVGGVKVKDIDFERKVMMTQILKRRQRIYKEALLDDELISVIKRYILKYKLGLEDYLFRKVSYRQIQQRTSSYAKKVKIPHKVSFHNFRHYFITTLSKKGYSHSDIAKLTGHSTVGVIAMYDHSIASDIRERAIKDIESI